MEGTCCQRLVKHVALITSLLLLSVTALGQAYSNANLNGQLLVQFWLTSELLLVEGIHVPDPVANNLHGWLPDPA